MNKNEIIFEQLVATAESLHTDDLQHAIELLDQLKHKKIVQVLESVEPKDILELKKQHHLACADEILELDVVFKLEVAINYNGMDSEPHFYCLRDHIYADEHITKNALLKTPKNKQIWDNKKKNIQNYRKLLQTLSDKYKISPHFLEEKFQ